MYAIWQMSAAATHAPRRVVLLGVALWLGAALFSWLACTPLGHDEAQYVLAAGDLLHGAPLRWHYLSIGMVLSSVPAAALGGGELGVRALPLLAGLGLVLAAARLARVATDDDTGGWLPAVLAASLCFARRAAENLSDLPATACLLLGLAIALEELPRAEGPRWRLVLAAPWLGLAFYVRYGSVLAIAVIGAALLATCWRNALRRPAPVLVTGAALAAMAIPHVLLASRLTGHALGILAESADVVPDEIGLVTYVTSNPISYYGAIAAPLLLLGAASIAWRRDVHTRLLWAIGVGDVIAVGLTTHGQSRYIFFGLALLLTLGTREVVRWTRGRAGWARRTAVTACALALLASYVSVLVSVRHLDRGRRRRLAPVLEAAAAIARDAGGRPCLAMARRSTTVEWYSGCEVVAWVEPGTMGARSLYLVTQPGMPEQPVVGERDARPHTVLDVPGRVLVTRFDPTPAAWPPAPSGR